MLARFFHFNKQRQDDFGSTGDVLLPDFAAFRR